ncbi:hypothetical protein FRC10_011652, partial [Ceratobasidium sp. 414]
TMLEMVTGQVPFQEKVTFGHVTITMIIRGDLRPERPDLTLSLSPMGEPFWIMLQSCWKGVPEARITATQLMVEVCWSRGLDIDDSVADN